MGKHFDNLPASYKTTMPLVNSTDKVPDVNALITEINYLRGWAVGAAIEADELEEKLELALAYQKEMDARLVESYLASVDVDSQEIRTINGELYYVKGMRHEMYTTTDGLANEIRKAE